MIPTAITLGRVMVGSVILGLFGLYSLVIQSTDPETEMRLEPRSGVTTLNKEFIVSVLVDSTIAVNAFSGQLLYDPEIIRVNKIEYNTSIANLWIEEPWYSNGDGTIKFAGGTTAPGGFTGSGSLLKINFTPIATGEAQLKLNHARIFIHDGFGTEADLNESIDALFTVAAIKNQAQLVVDTESKGRITVISDTSPFDLNNDDIINLADISIFMINILGNNSRFDFNQDGQVNTTDLSLLLEARN